MAPPLPFEIEPLPATLGAVMDAASARHSLAYSQGKLGNAHRPGSAYSGYGFHGAEAPERSLVKAHPETGRRSLAIGRHAFAAVGPAGAMGEVESERFLEGVVEAACQPPRVWTHAWTAGDAVVWDNRCLLHQAMPWDMREPRVMYHSRIAGDVVARGCEEPSTRAEDREGRSLIAGVSLGETRSGRRMSGWI